MSIFPKLIVEPTVQVNDKTRIDCTKCYASKEEAEISKVEIQPSGTDSFIEVTGSSSADWYLDWEYSTDGDQTVTCRVTTDGSPVTSTATITVVTVATDNLFSSDSDLTSHEPDIMSWLPDGHSSWNFMHRRSQKLIIDWFSRKGFLDDDNEKFVVSDFLDVDDVREWSTFLTLKLIFKQISNAIDDVFGEKAVFYETREKEYKRRKYMRVDFDGDGELDDSEIMSFSSVTMERA